MQRTCTPRSLTENFRALAAAAAVARAVAAPRFAHRRLAAQLAASPGAEAKGARARRGLRRIGTHVQQLQMGAGGGVRQQGKRGVRGARVSNHGAARCGDKGCDRRVGRRSSGRRVRRPWILSELGSGSRDSRLRRPWM
eukprot:265916-Chlamydomonas_euryale.AAC.1